MENEGVGCRNRKKILTQIKINPTVQPLHSRQARVRVPLRRDKQTLFLGDVDKAGVLNDVLDARPPAGGHVVKDEATTPSNVDKVKGDEAGARSNKVDAIALMGIAVDNEARNPRDVSSSKTANYSRIRTHAKPKAPRDLKFLRDWSRPHYNENETKVTVSRKPASLPPKEWTPGHQTSYSSRQPHETKFD
jgi:hypothetical protein